MPNKRLGETQRECERSERFFQVEDEWFFAVRGGGYRGPYVTKREAIWACGEFIHDLQKAEVWPQGLGAANI